MKKEAPQRKNHRYLETEATIKDALLRLIEKQAYEDINVSMLCREAGLSRGTFYLHYTQVDEVLTALIDDAIVAEGLDERTMALVEALDPPSTPALRSEDRLPQGEQQADGGKYRVLLMNGQMSHHINRRIFAREQDKVIPVLMKRAGLDQEAAELLYRFIIYGSYRVNRKLGWQKDERWYRIQELMSEFCYGGFRRISRRR